MSNLSDWINWAVTQDAKGTLPDFSATTPGLTPPAQHDTPDEHGFVALTGLSPDSYYATKRYAIKEIADSLPEGPAKDCATRNVNVARAYWIIEEFIPVCREVGTGRQMLNGENIPNTFACPPSDRTGDFLNTVAAATKHFAALPNPVTGAPFPHV